MFLSNFGYWEKPLEKLTLEETFTVEIKPVFKIHSRVWQGGGIFGTGIYSYSFTAGQEENSINTDMIISKSNQTVYCAWML